MKKHYWSIPIIVGLFYSCSEVSKTDIMNEIKTSLVKELPNPSITEEENGDVSITQDETTFLLYKDKIFTGDLDDDNETDIIYTVGINEGGNMVMNSHFAVISSMKEEFEFELEPNSVISEVSNKKIYVHEFSYAEGDPNCCPSERHIVRYSFIGDKIVKIN